MKYSLIKFILIPLLFSFNLSAQKTLLYEISGNGLSKSSFVFGTMHIICSNDFVMRESVRKRVEESEQLALELDMDDPAAMMKMMSVMNFKDGKTLKDIMNEADYNKLAKFFKDSLSLSLNMLSKLKPVAIMSMVTDKYMDCPKKSYEMEFVQMAKSQKKELYGLESVEFQVSIFDNIKNEDVTKMLLEMADKHTSNRKDMLDMVQHYKNQDLGKLQEDMAKGMKGYEGYEKSFLEDRNKDWIPKIGKMSKEKSTFFAVGAGHLGGENGLLNLLKKEGYTIKAVE